MDMIRWLATNKVVVIVWGLGILAILLASVFGGGKKDTAQPTAEVETKVVETTDAATEAVKSVSVAASEPTVAAVALSKAQSAADTNAEVKTDAVKEASAETEVAVVTKADTSAESTNEEAQTATTTTPSEGTEGSADQTTSAVKEDDFSDKSSDDLLMMAREAYWDNGLDKAASLYSELITREPNVIEHKGELGNVLWRQGYPKKAAELYADIAEPMIAKGNGERVSNMVGFRVLLRSEIRFFYDASWMELPC